jgi:RimJ/RimL family protein N-acetyltransferase
MINLSHPSPLQTELPELTLRAITLKDSEAYLAAVLANQDHLSQFGDETAAKYQSIEDVRQSYFRTLGRKARWGMWVDETEFAGTINLTPHARGEAEVGYWVGQAYTGRHFATQAVKAVAEYGLGEYDALGIVHEDNKASKAVLLGAGFDYVGSETKNTLEDRYTVDIFRRQS